MRNWIIAALAVFAVGCTSYEDVVITFDVDDVTAKEVVIVCHNEVNTFILDEQGHAEAVLDKYDMAYARVFYGMESKWIYFEKGDRASVNFNGRDFASSFVFEGEKSAAVDYLNRVKLTALPDEDYALDFKQYHEKIKAKEADALKLLKANSLGSAGNFVKSEEGRIRYSYAAPLLMHPMGYKLMSGNPYYEPDQAYYDVIADYMQENLAWVDLEEYRSFILEAAHVLDPENRNVASMYPKTVAQMKYIADNFTKPQVRDVLLHDLAATYVDRYGIDDIQDLENIYHTYVKDEALKADFSAKYEKWDLSKPGKMSPDFVAKDLSGKTWSLKDFRGKYIYIDMWATWCAPCKKEFPYMKQLEARFKDANIVFLGLSTDRDKDKWVEMASTDVLSGVQLYLGPQSNFQKAYNIDGIPRFILLDREGKIISNDMTRPSSDETALALESLEGIR